MGIVVCCCCGWQQVEGDWWNVVFVQQDDFECVYDEVWLCGMWDYVCDVVVEEMLDGFG